jgi:hypothetical protein
VALVDLGRPRRDPLTRELPDQVTDLALLFRQRLVRHADKCISQSLVGQYVASAAMTTSSNRITSVFTPIRTGDRRNEFRSPG